MAAAAVTKIIRELAGILLLAVVLALGTNALRTNSLSLSGPAGSAGGNTGADATADGPGIASIGIEAAIAHYGKGDALFIDARPVADFQQGHIKGALNLPDHTFDEWIADFMANTSPDTLVITYCAGESCHLSTNLAEKLKMAGYERATHLVDGWGKWQAAGMPTGSGTHQ